MKRLLTALALVGGVAVSGVAHAHLLTHVPGNTNGGTFEVGYSTNFVWEADAWNMIRSPEGYAAAVWVDSGATHVADAADGPFPGTRAVRVTSDVSGVTTHSLYQAVVSTASVITYTYSVYAKWVAGNQYVATRVGGVYCAFNIVTGAAGSCVGGATGRIEAVGNGWWRISTTGSGPGTATTPTYLALVNSIGTSMSFAGDGVTSALFWGPQLLRDATDWKPYVSPPVPSLLSNTTRFDVASSWAPVVSGGKSVTVLADQDRAPDGTMTADAVTFSAITADGSYAALRQTTPYGSTGTLTFTVWARLANGTGTMPMHLTGGSPYFGQTYCAISTEWTRCTLTAAQVVGGTVGAGIGAVFQNSNGITQTQPAQTVYLWGARLTRSDYPAETVFHTTASPFTTVTPVYPGGFSAPARLSYGPLAGSSNRLTYGGAVIEPADLYDFRTCAAFTLTTPPAAAQGLTGSGNVSTTGHQLYLETAGTCTGLIGNVSVTTANAAAVGGPNVCCYGRVGTTGYVRLNNGATVTQTVTNTLDLARGFYIASVNAGTAPFNSGVIHGVVVDADGWTEDWVTKQVDRFLGRVDAHATPLSITRTTTETYTAGNVLWNAPGGTLAVTADGFGSFHAAANGALQSETSCVAGAVNAPWALSGVPTCTADVSVAPDGTTTADSWVMGSNVQRVANPSSIPTTATGVGSMWMRKPSGTGPVTLHVRCQAGTVSVCTCGAENGEACTPTVGVPTADACQAVFPNATTTWVRRWASATCAAPTGNWNIGFASAEYGVSTGTAEVWGAQIEPGLQPTPYKKTTSGTVQANASLITTQNKVVAQDTTWCVAGVWTPYLGRPWARTDGVVNTLWSTGTYNAANSGRVEILDGNLVFTLRDGTNTSSEVRYALGALTGSRTVRACIADGRQALYLDGALVAAGKLPPTADWQTTPQGAWTTPPATWAIGARGDNTAHFDGYTKDFKVENTAFTKADLDALDARLALAAPFTASGPLIEDDVNTTFHWVADEWNVIRFPEAIDQWTLAGGFLVDKDVVVAPNGQMTADRITKNSNASSASPGLLFGLLPAAGEMWTLSFYVKAGTFTTVTTGIYTSGWPTAISATLEGPGTLSGSGPYSVTNLSTTAWSKLTLTYRVTGSSTVFIYPGGTGAGGLGNNLYLWGVSLYRSEGGVRPYKSPPVANMASSPTNYAQAPWTAQVGGTGSAAALVANAAMAPNGTMTATRITLNRGAGDTSGDYSRLYQSVSLVSGSVYNYSAWLKHAGTPCTIAIESGSGARVNVTLTNEWVKYTAQPYTATVTGFNSVAFFSDRGLYGTTRGCTFYAWGGEFTRPDQNGDTLTMTGTLPVATSSPFFKDGYGTGRRFVGPFSSTDYIQPYPAASDPLDSTGDRFGIVAFVGHKNLDAPRLLWSNGDAAVAGNYLSINTTTGTIQHGSRIPADTIIATANGHVLGALNVGCWWRTGTSISVRLNNGVTATNASAGSEVSGTAYIAKIGRNEGASPFPMDSGGVVEMVQGLGAPAGYSSPEAWCADQTAKALANGDPTKPLFTPPSNALMYLRGDDYKGGPYWPSPLASATEVGTVGFSDAFVPPIDGRLQRLGYGPFNATSYLRLAGSSVLGFPSGTGSICWVYVGRKTGSTAITESLGAAGAFNASGWQMTDDGTFYVNGAGTTATIGSATTTLADGVNVYCAGVNGGRAYVKNNLAAFGQSAGAVTYVVPTVDATIGWYQATRFTNGFLYEVWASSEAPSDALFTKIQQRVLTKLAGTQTTLTNARSTTASAALERPADSTGARLFLLPANSVSHSPQGVGVWKQSTNTYLTSRSACAAGNVPDTGWTFYQLTCANDVTTGPDLRPADQFTQIALNGGPYQTSRSHPTTTTQTTSSVYGKMTGATAGFISTMARCGAGLQTACTCARDDGGACTPVPNALATTDCGAKATIDPGKWVRLSATVTCDTSSVLHICAAYPGEIAVSTNSTAYLANLQCESGPYMTPWIETAAAGVQRNADAITAPLPADLAYANLVTRSEDLATTWGGGGGAVTPNQGPAGFTDLDRMTVASANNVQFQTYTATTATTGPFTASAWMAADTGTDVQTLNGYCIGQNVTGVSCTRTDGAVCTTGSSTTNAWAYGTSTTTPTRWTLTWSCVGATTQFGMGFHDGRYAVDVGNGSLFGRAQLVYGTAPQTYLPTAAAITYSDQKWCVDGYWTPGWNWNEAVTTQIDPWGIGTAGQANTARIFFTTDRFYWQFWDGATATVRDLSSLAHGLTGRNAARWTACQNNGTQTVWVDNVLKGTETAGGTGLWTATPSTIDLGRINNVGGLEHFNGWIRGFRVVKGVTTPQEIDNLFGK